MRLLVSDSWRKVTFPALFAKAVAGFPTSLALALRGESMSYAELDDASDNLARHLSDIDVCHGTLVGVCLPRSFEMVVGMLAIMKAGAAYVPIDPSYPRARIEYMLGDSGVKTVLSLSSVALTEFREKQQWVDLDTLRHVQNAQDKFVSPCAPDDLAYVIYTSGSTGAPKGVMIEQGSVANLLLGLLQRVAIDSQMRWLGIAPIVFDASVGDWMACLASGGCYVIPDEHQVDDPFTLAGLIDTVQVVVATPSRWKQVIATGWKGNATLTVMCGGEPLTSTLLADLVARCNVLWNCYGPTEATVWSLVRKVQGSPPGDDGLYIGGTLPNYRHMVLDEQNQPVAEGQVGELCIAGAGLARAYLNKPELTAQKFVSLDFAAGNPIRIYKTGDLVRQLGDDTFAFVGRADNQIKIRGYRVELGEIESKLRSLPHTHDAVVSYTEPDMSHADRVLVAYLEIPETNSTAMGGQTFDALEEEHRSEIARQLPDYMIPSIFVYLPSFPLNANGKVDRKSLPHPRDVSRTGCIAEPKTSTQKTLVQIWAGFFPGRRFGITDSFFSLGGNSLLGVSLVNQIRYQFNFPSFTLNDVMEFSTIEKQARLIDLNSFHEDSRSNIAERGEREVILL